MARKNRVWRLQYTVVPALAFLVALGTGYLLNNGTDYGFPVTWRHRIVICAESILGGCFSNTTYNWTYLFLDAAFYAVVGYACFMAREEIKKTILSLRRFLTQLQSRRNALPRAFRISVVMGLLGGTYFAYSLPPWLIIAWWLSASPASDGGLSSILLSITLPLLYYTILVVLIAGTLGLLNLQMNDERRGILAMFLTACSFVPIVFLGFQILGWILKLWQISLVALEWAGLLFMATRVLRSKQNRAVQA